MIGMLLPFIFLFNTGMELMENKDELGVLIEQGKSEAEIEKELTADQKAFEEVTTALIHKTLTAGAKKTEVSRHFGAPVTKSEDQDGEEWMYRSRQGVRWEKAWIVLNFDKGGKLKDWDCSRVQCR